MKTSKKQKYVKPQVVSKELSLHALLGENGWFDSSKSKLLAVVPY